jgi:signal transduction histidine kinase
MTDTFSWVHISDLHYGLPGQPAYLPNICEALHRDLEELNPITGACNAILFTGDLVQSGTESQFNELDTNFLKPLLQHISTLNKFDPIILAVPGNHDVTRTPTLKPNNKLAQKLLKDPIAFSTLEEDLWQDTEPWVGEIEPFFIHYNKWWTSLSHRPSKLRHGLLPGDFSTSLSWGSTHIGVIGLNTSFLHIGSGDYRGKLTWNVAQLNKLCDNRIVEWRASHICCLLMTHHGPAWLHDKAKTHGEQEITIDNRFLMHLFGHEHDSETNYIQRNSVRNPPNRHQVGSLFGEQISSEHRKQREHAYTITQLRLADDSLTIRNWPRRAVNIEGWRFVPDFTRYVLNNDGGTAPQEVRTSARPFGLKRPSQTAESTSSLISTEETLREVTPQTTRYDDPLSDFTKRLAKITPEATTGSVLPTLTRIWREESGATWAWLWIYNRYSKTWDLVFHDHRPEDQIPNPGDLSVGEDSVCELVAQTRKPKTVIEPNTWKDIHGSRVFTVGSASFLSRNSCNAFVAVPLLTPAGHTNDDNPQLSEHLAVRAAICLHFSSRTHADSFTESMAESTLLTMGTMSAMSISAAFNAERLGLLYKLNELSAEHLTRFSKRPEKTRKEYLSRLIPLIRASLGVHGVTLFYREPLLNEVVCLATTGLLKSDGTPIEQNSLSEVRYTKNEGRTGNCFWTSRPAFITSAAVDNRAAKFIEVSSKGLITEFPTLMWPITGARNPPGVANAILGHLHGASGVLRVTERISNPNISSQHTSRFTPIEAEILAFIAEQIGPVLQTLTIHMIRQKSLQVAKHDLDSLSQAIEKTAASINDAASSRQPIPPYLINDLEATQMLVNLLLSQISPGSLERVRPRFERTLLLGDIIARSMALLRHLAKSMPTKVEVEYRKEDFDQLPYLWVDRILFERALLNVAVNGIKYSNEATKLTISCRSEHEFFCIDVSNLGIGIEKRDARHIFKPYFRGRRAKKVAQGAGLGLQIASQYIEAHGGSIALSELGGSGVRTVFTIRLPKALTRKPKA